MATTRIDLWNNAGHETRRRGMRRSGGDDGARAEWMPGLWLRSAVIIGTATFLGAGSASASLALARRTEERDLLDAGASAADLLEETRS